MTDKKIRHLITVDDDQQFKEDALNPVFESFEGWKHISDAGTAKKQLEKHYRQNDRPDMIILDMQIGANDTAGLALTKIVRKNPSLAGVPVVIVSVSSTEQNICESYKAGANLYFTKRETNSASRPIITHLSNLLPDLQQCKKSA